MPSGFGPGRLEKGIDPTSLALHIIYEISYQPFFFFDNYASVDEQNKKPRYYQGFTKGKVPRDRIELPTRGFSVTTSGFSNLLKLL
jgi:hypothetical protein